MRRLILCSLVTGLCAGATTTALSATTSGHDLGGSPFLFTSQPAQGAGSGLTGSYFANGSLAGAPLQQRVDPSISFNWGTGAPGPDLSDDNFSIRWEGLLAAPATGSYRFIGKTVDEVRVWVNGKKIIDTFNGNKVGATGSSGIALAAGEKTTIKIEFAAGEGEAQFQMMWAPPGQGPQVIPTAYLYPQGSSSLPDPAGTAVAAAPAAPKPAPAAPAKVVAKAKVEPKPREAKPAPAPVAKPEAKVAKAAPAPAKPDPAIAKAEKATAKAAAKAAKETPPAPALEPGVYVLTSRTTGKPLEIDDPSRPNSRIYNGLGTASKEADSRNQEPQWRIERLADGFYRLVVPGNNRVLEVLGSSTSNGAEMDLWPYYSGNNQVWRIEPTENGYYKLLAKHSNKALTAKDSAAGTIQQWRYTGKENQMWKLKPAKSEEPTAVAMASSKPGVGANKMSIYPNPSNGVVQLRYELPEEIPMGWVLYNQNGAPVRVSDYRRQPKGAHHQTLDFTGLPAGDYNLRMTVGTVTTREQLQLRNPKADPVPTAPLGSN
ncbi:PA14 domain-containing protein [Hymenobacter cellulosilyticus]|uniref:PA14 domain-containing protein n=1 Tax=Hymenobacter cellulosilyticus TaxID=2932248 RepID=A0A8T9Q4R3_9BACT|nr:PA14 domain-containing protein [Hymenobacter cellulosilyticus]UOQ71962.1 PA14 domain-containing protein [Hymenobacter cellulosilyticus]